MNKADRVVDKLTSGQWILSVASGFVFIFGTWQGIIPSEAVVGIITMVFVSYFKRDRTEKTEQ